MGFLADDLYERLASAAAGDEELGYPLRAYVRGLMAMFQQVADYARESDDEDPPWAPMLDPDLAPDEAGLRFLSQFAGVALPVGEDEAALRERLSALEGRERGTPAQMVREIQRTLTGGKLVILAERDTSAYHFSVTTRTSETPDPAATVEAIRRAKPATLQFDHAVVTGATWAEATGTWGSPAGGVSTWGDTLETAP